jgi:hypothetical protein
MQKADIGALDKRGATTLYNLVNAAGVYNRDNTASIKLLIDSKSPLKTQNSHLSIIERAVTYKMHPVLTLLVAAKADLNERSVAGQTCLHQIASLQQGEADETACKIFDILKQHGNLPIDNVVFQGKESYTALCFSRMGNKQKTGLVQRLLAHGANPYCPMSNSHRYCKQGDGMEAQAIHEAWKTDAHNAVVEKIPVTPLTNMVIDYCFGNPNFVSKKRKFE